MPWLMQIVITLAIVGLVLWIVGQIPMDPVIARIIRVIVIVIVCLYLLQLLVAMFGGFSLVQPPRYPR